MSWDFEKVQNSKCLTYTSVTLKKYLSRSSRKAVKQSSIQSINTLRSSLFSSNTLLETLVYWERYSYLIENFVTSFSWHKVFGHVLFILINRIPWINNEIPHKTNYLKQTQRRPGKRIQVKSHFLLMIVSRILGYNFKGRELNLICGRFLVFSFWSTSKD